MFGRGPVTMNKTLPILLYIWSAGVFAAYLYQFRNFVGPVLRLFGLA